MMDLASQHTATSITIPATDLRYRPSKDVAQLWITEYNRIAADPEIQEESIVLVGLPVDGFHDETHGDIVAHVRGSETGTDMVLCRTTDASPSIVCRMADEISYGIDDIFVPVA